MLSGWALLVEVFLWAGFLWALILGPVAFLALLLVRGASDRHASVARLIGAFGGWASFLSLFFSQPFGTWFLSAYKVPFGPLLGVLTAALLILAGLVVADLCVRWARRYLQPKGR